MPNRNSRQLKEFAQRLMACEAAAGKGADGEGAFRICEKLRVSLGSLMGVAGYRALFSRALALAGSDVAWLRDLQVQPDGKLGGLTELKLKSEEIAVGEVALVGALLGLMVTFIGPTLTLQLVQQTWPKADLSEFGF